MKRGSRLFWGAFVALLGVLYVSSAMAIDVPVSVTNGSGKSGRVYLSIVTGAGTTGTAGSTGIGKSVAIAESATADVTIAGLQQDGSYRIKAFLDTQDRGWQHANDPTGETSFSILAGAVAAPAEGIQLTLTPPAPVAAAPTPSVDVMPGPDWAFVFWNNPDNGEGLEVAESYNVYWSTDSDPNPDNAIGALLGLPAVDGAPLLIPNLEPNTSLYVAVVPVLDGVEQLAAKGVNSQPVQIGGVQEQSGSSVTVTVNSAGIAKDPGWPTPLVVAVVNDSDDIRLAVVNSPTDSETVTVNGVPAGTYKIYTALDLYGNGYLAGGLGVVGLNDAVAPIVTVDGVNPVTAETVDLSTQLSVNADVRLGVDHGRDLSATGSDSYALSFRIGDQASHVVNVRLDGLGIDVAREEWYHEFNHREHLASRPTVGDTFGITVEYADGTVETLSPRVTAVLDSFATPTAPVGIISSTTPTFTWTAPEAPPAPYWYDIWFNNGGGSDQRIPSGQLSVPYDFNGWMSPLMPGSYDWSIVVADRYGNTAHQTAPFMVPDPPISFSGFVKSTDGAGLANITVEMVVRDSALSAVTGDDGSFTISGIPAGIDFTLRTRGTGIVDTYFGPFNSKSDLAGRTLQVLSTEQLSSWNVSSGKGVIIGQVVGPGSGQPLAGATVTGTGGYQVLYDNGSGVPVAGSATGSNGVFYILNVDDGSAVTIGAGKEGWSFGEVSVTGRANAVTRCQVRVMTLSYSGTVVSSEGAAIGGVTVTVDEEPSIATVTSDNGNFVLKGIPAGRQFTLVFNKETYAPLYTTPMFADSDIVEPVPFMLWLAQQLDEASGKALISGVVLDYASKAVSGVELVAASTLHPDTPYTVTYYDTIGQAGSATNGSGRYLVAGVDPGDTVAITPGKSGWEGPTRFFTAHAGAVTDGRIRIFKRGLSADPGSFNFGTVTLGAASAPQMVTFTNVSGSNLTVVDSTITGPDSNMFELKGAGEKPCPELPATFAPGESCTLAVTFKPTGTGPKGATSSTITSDGSIAPLMVPLNGFGIPDTTPPEASFSVKSAVNALTVPVLSFSATDDIGVTGYLITETSDAPDAAATSWSEAAPATYTFATAGKKTLWAWARDAAGNVSAARSATVNVDLTAPVVSTFTFKTPVNTLAVPITSIVSSDAAGGTGVVGYLITTTSLQPLATAGVWSATAPKSYAFTSAGIKKVWIWAKDAAGNVSAGKAAVVNVDMTPPVVSAFTVKTPVNTSVVPVTSFIASDASGLTGYMITATPLKPLATATGWSLTVPKSFTVSGAGIRTLYAWVRDAAGNVSALKSATVNVDVTAPLVTAFTVKSPVNTLAVPVTALTATDASGVAGYLITATSTKPLATATGWSVLAPKSYTVAGAGIRTLYAWAKDAAGNVSALKSATVNVDLTAPLVTAFSVPAKVNTLTVPVATFTASDATGVAGYLVTSTSTKPLATATGWSATPPKSFPFATKGTKVLYGWAKDAAGNVSLAKTATVVIY